MNAARRLAEQAYFQLCLTAGRLLRSGRYSRIRIVDSDGERCVRKNRRFYAPFLIWMGDPLVRILGAGVRILPQREWEERERRLYGALRGTSIRICTDGTLVLPYLPGRTLAALLEDSRLGESGGRRAIGLAVVALADFHRQGFTHGDAMAENVMIDLANGSAHWFDFETIHDPARPITWQRADDVRALLTTCLARAAPEKRAEIIRVVLDLYGDERVARVLSERFTSMLQRPLTFHLAQAPLSCESFRQIARLLNAGGAP